MKIFIILFSLGFISLATHAATKDVGNGGGVHLCENGKIEVYDVYEGFTRYNLTPTYNRRTKDEYIAKALNKIESSYPGIGVRVKKELEYLNAGHFLIRKNLRIFPIYDANILVTDIGCQYAQLANWDNMSGNVLVKEEYYILLDELNKAAIYLHEALYKVAREHYNYSDSDDVRKTVAESLNDEAQFTHFETWANQTRDSKVVASRPADLALKINSSPYKNPPEVTFHLGDINFYNDNTQVKVKVKIEMPELKTILKKNKKQITDYNAQIEELKRKQSKVIFASQRREYEKQINELESKLFTLNYENRDSEKLFDSLDSKIYEYQQGGTYKVRGESFDRTPEGGQKVLVTYYGIINDRIVAEKAIELEIQYHYIPPGEFSQAVIDLIDLKFTQNPRGATGP